MMLKRTVLAAFVAALALGVSHAADLSRIPNPMKNAKAGQWVSYSSAAGMDQKQSITKVEGQGDDLIVTVKMEIMMGDTPLQANEVRISLKEAKAQQDAMMSMDPNVKISDAKVDIDGKTFDAILVELAVQGVTTKMYMSEDIPVTGVVKVETSVSPEPVMVIKDWSK